MTSANEAANHTERDRPETLRLKDCAPAFTVNDLSESIRWYTEVLGFMVENEWKNDEGTTFAASLKAGNAQFNLGQDDFKKGKDRVKGVGFRLYCETAQDVDALAARIKAAGSELVAEPTDQPWGMRDFTVRDPDGFVITIWKAIPGGTQTT